MSQSAALNTGIHNSQHDNLIILDGDLQDNPEELEEKMKLKYDKGKEGWYDEKGRRRYLSIGATNAIMRKKLDHAMKTGDWTDFNKEEVSYEETV